MITPAYRFGSLLGSAEPDWDFDSLELHVDEAAYPGGVIVEQGKLPNLRFKARIPRSVFDGSAHRFTIVGDAGPVTETIEVDADSLWGNRYDSHAVVAGGLCVEGWVQDAADPDRVVTLTAALDGEDFRTFAPDETRRPIAALYGGHEQCGFALDVPEDLVDEQTRELTLRTDDGQLLRGFPRDIDIDIAIEHSLRALGRSRTRILERCALHWAGSES